MPLSNLPRPVLTLLLALQNRDRSAIRSVLSGTAVLYDAGRTYEGGNLLAWFELRFFGEPGAVHLISKRVSQGSVVLTFSTDEPNPAGAAGNVEHQWTLAMKADEIATIAVEPCDMPILPRPVAAYVRATNRHDLEALLTAFHDNALVNDQLCEYRGKEAIRKWAKQDVIDADLTMHVVSALEHHDHTIVTAHVDGAFDRRGLPDPLVLTFYFSTTADQVVLLIILRNETYES